MFLFVHLEVVPKFYKIKNEKMLIVTNRVKSLLIMDIQEAEKR